MMENHLLSVITGSISHSSCLVIKRRGRMGGSRSIGDFATY